jgi:hypothetical protein
VDDGSRGKFGGEIDFRANLELELRGAEGNKCPIVTIVVQGGPGTIKCVFVLPPSNRRTARDSIANGTPLVVIRGSGMAADLIAYAWEYLHSTR